MPRKSYKPEEIVSSCGRLNVLTSQGQGVAEAIRREDEARLTDDTVELARPKGLSEVRMLAQQHTAAAIERLVRVMAESESDLAAVGAANALLDRGWGKPTQIEVDIDLNLGLERERVSEDIARIFGLSPAVRPAADAQGGWSVVPGKARLGRKARARSG